MKIDLPEDLISRRSFLGTSATLIGALPFLSWSPRAWAGLAPMAFWKRKTVTAATIAEAIDFDGVNDYLSRNSDFVGNADGKTFTFSAWVWWITGRLQIFNTDASSRFLVQIENGGLLQILARNTANTIILNATVTISPPSQTFFHVLISCDLSNPASRSIYINDVAASVTWTTYLNTDIDFTVSSHKVAATTSTAIGRLAHVFLDHTYRDLNSSTNRRLFITADLKPATKSGVAALNPILYLPTDDPATVNINLGTGGDFTLNGTIARSGRGPNQYNTPYSDLDGAADYVSRATVLAGATSSQSVTGAFVMNTDATSGTNQRILHFRVSGTNALRFAIYRANTTNHLYFIGNDNAGTERLHGYLDGALLSNGRNLTVTFSFDLTSTTKRFIFINGIDRTSQVTWATYSSAGSIDFAGANNIAIGADYQPGLYFDGRLGSVFLHTSYIDLSVPANLGKFVTGTGIDAKPADFGADGSAPLGVQPLIYLPMYGNNAGKNYGSGGDFAVNGSPFTGMRGPSEFWGNKAHFGEGLTNSLSRTFNTNTSTGSWVFSSASSYASSTFTVGSLGTLITMVRYSSGNLEVTIKNSVGTTLVQKLFSGVLTDNTWYTFFLSFNLATPSAQLWIVGTSGDIYLANTSWTTLTSGSAHINTTNVGRSNVSGPGTGSSQKTSEFFFTTEYLDFSQEVNRLKFRDAFGNPVDLGSDGSRPTGTEPLIYLRFDPANFGKNRGSGGDFTVNGTITDGGQL